MHLLRERPLELCRRRLSAALIGILFLLVAMEFVFDRDVLAAYGVKNASQTEDNKVAVVQQHNEDQSFPKNVGKLSANFSNKGCLESSSLLFGNGNKNSALATQTSRKLYRNASFYLTESSQHQFFPLSEYDHIAEGYGFVPGGVTLFQNAWIGGERPPAVFDCRSVYVPGGCKSQEGSKQSFSMEYLARNIAEDRVVVLDKAVFIYQYWSESFYHAMVESLPRLAYVLDYLRANPDVAIIAAPNFLISSGRSQTLNSVLGLKNPWMAYIPRRSSIFVRELLVPTGSRCGRVQPHCLEIIQRAANEYCANKSDPFRSGEIVGKETITSTKKTTILVQKRQSRKIKNHSDLMKSIKESFPECTVVEYYGTESLEDSIQLHFATDVLVGPHGAGLSLSMFTNRKAVQQVGMVELHPQFGNVNGSEVNTCHQATARAAGMSTRLVAQTDGSGFADFAVNVTAAIEAIRDVVTRR